MMTSEGGARTLSPVAVPLWADPRYLLDGQRWDNDWAADAYVRNDFGGDDSVVDLTALAEAVPPAARKTPAKKEAVREAPAQTAKKATPTAKRAGRTAK